MAMLTSTFREDPAFCESLGPASFTGFGILQSRYGEEKQLRHSTRAAGKRAQITVPAGNKWARAGGTEWAGVRFKGGGLALSTDKKNESALQDLLGDAPTNEDALGNFILKTVRIEEATDGNQE